MIFYIFFFDGPKDIKWQLIRNFWNRIGVNNCPKSRRFLFCMKESADRATPQLTNSWKCLKKIYLKILVEKTSFVIQKLPLPVGSHKNLKMLPTSRIPEVSRSSKKSLIFPVICRLIGFQITIYRFLKNSVILESLTQILYYFYLINAW